ncbi:hypothetical protein PHYBOEH_004659 [Phytophthora boehmeriae]|uniref:PH domain-containing protein n=1 Tax=Phytophthora boehmeriae TaxID=109152 RepID=A0A8T1WNJ1_9STRA|nr:hypothetical protein PHYBOEH_004659 [Phytophthora boehmeriae]
MESNHSSHSIRGFLKAKKQQRRQKQQQKRQLRQSQEQQQQVFARDSATSSFSSHVAASEASSSSVEEIDTGGQEQTAVKMEGMLKKRAAKMPVMHDRYCVATWEMDSNDHKCVVLRSYKSRKTYDAHPERPTSVHQLKCISDWDGKTGFHRYQNAFTMETRDKKLFQCVAPSAAEKDKWVELMAIQSAFSLSSSGGLSGGRDVRLGSVGSLVPLRRTASIESTENGKPRAYTNSSMDKKLRTDSDMNGVDAHSTDSEDHLQFPTRDGLFRSVSGESLSSADISGDKTGEPADWGLYGENGDATTSKYDVADDAKPVLLDKELLDSRGEKTKKLAADAYLFEDGHKSRFGAVVVKGAEGNEEDDGDNEFVDEELAARQARRENEKQMRRRAEKLESNRDRYAEMAAARLASMRKDARHPKKSTHSHSRPSTDSYSEEEELDESIVAEVDAESVTELEEVTHRRSRRSRRSSKNHKKSFASSSEHDDLEEDHVHELVDEGEDVAEVEESTQRLSTRSRRSSKNHKKSVVSSNENTNSLNGGYVSGSDDEEEEEEIAAPTAAESEEAEELRMLKKRYRAERRAKKRLQREKEEEERAAVQAAELARAHREEQRAREEAKAREEQEKRDKKERREMKEKLKREKAKQRQAEAELRKLVELKQAEEERREQEHKEKKEKKEKKKTKKKEKYTTPAERILKKEERDANRAAASAATSTADAEVSNALVVVETPKSASQPSAASETAIAAVPTSTSSSSQTDNVAAEQTSIPAPVAPVASVAPVAPVVPVPAPAPAPIPAPATTDGVQNAFALPQGVPMYQMVPPPFVPTYPSGPQSMPAYGLAATFGAYPPLYQAPYSYGAPVGPQPTYMRPNLGFVAGLSAMGSFGKATGPEPAPSSEETAEAMIGPQLPTPEERAAASSTGGSVFSPPPPPPPPTNTSGAKLTNLPELPDVVEF